MADPAFSLGELVYLTNRLARGSPDQAFTETSGPGMITEVITEKPYRARYTDISADHAQEYGTLTEKRRIYRLFQEGRFFWMKDIEVRPKYYTPNKP